MTSAFRHLPASHPVLQRLTPEQRERHEQPRNWLSEQIDILAIALRAIPDVPLTVEQTRSMGVISDEVLRRVMRSEAA